MCDLSTEELDKKIREFVDIAEKLPERYREKCFEVLFSDYLETRASALIEKEIAPTAPKPQEFTIPIDVKAFLQQYNVPEEAVKRLFLIEGTEVRPIYKMKADAKSEAQIRFALLTALENALRSNGSFEFSIEIVRQKCRDHDFYDQDNFKTNFRNNADLFRDMTDEEHVGLSPDGKARLADVMLEILE